MANKSKTREINIVDESGAFATFFKKFSADSPEYNLDGLSLLRKLLSNEKAKALHTIKTKKPSSIYSLAKLLKRDFKSVFSDVKLLERFGFVDFISEKTGKRERLKPVLIVDSIIIKIKV